MHRVKTGLVCPYCGADTNVVRRGSVGKNPPNEWIHICDNFPTCDSYVGCHPRSKTPLGSLADRKLRFMRYKAHRALDWLWKKGFTTRSQAYRQLSITMGVPLEDAHIGRCTKDECQLVIDTFNRLRPWKMPIM